jgi:beta-lactamase class A
MGSMIDAPALPPPALVAPAPREASFGIVAGRLPAGTRQIVVRVGERVVLQVPHRRRSFSVSVPLPSGLTRVRVTAVDGRERRSTATVDQVYGLPDGSRPGERAPRLDPTFQRTLRALVQQHGGTAGVYVQDLRSGRGASWNALARFPAASTLKLAIAVTALRRLDGKPANGTRLAGLLARMLTVSDNEAANELEVWLAGSTAAGSHVVDETMRALGMRDSLMFGGYEVTRRPAVAGAPIPLRVESQPSFPFGKYTTAADLARLARVVYLAAAGKGPLLRLGVTGSEARYLLFLLAQTSDHGKLDRFLGGLPVVLHKAGWLPTARHDSGVVAFRGGAFVASVLTWRMATADELAGRIALFAFDRYAAG